MQVIHSNVVKVGDNVRFKGTGSAYHYKGIVEAKTDRATVVKTNLGTFHVPHHEVIL